MRAALIREKGALPELAEIAVPGGDALEILAAPLNPPRIVTIGLMGGADATISNRPLRGRHMSLLGHSMYAVPADEFAGHYARLAGHAVAGEIVVDVERVPLSDAPKAWRRKTAGTAGKIVFVP